MPISSPCVGVCQARAGACIGCRRTLAEIAAWASLEEAERVRIMREELPGRGAGGPVGPAGPAAPPAASGAAESLDFALRGGRAALPAGKTGAKGCEIPQGQTRRWRVCAPRGSEFGAAPAKRSADLGPWGPQVGVSTSGTRAAGALGPAPTLVAPFPRRRG